MSGSALPYLRADTQDAKPGWAFTDRSLAVQGDDV